MRGEWGIKHNPVSPYTEMLHGSLWQNFASCAVTRRRQGALLLAWTCKDQWKWQGEDEWGERQLQKDINIFRHFVFARKWEGGNARSIANLEKVSKLWDREELCASSQLAKPSAWTHWQEHLPTRNVNRSGTTTQVICRLALRPLSSAAFLFGEVQHMLPWPATQNSHVSGWIVGEEKLQTYA